MAVYTPESLRITRPEGGFQTGGWYQGRQYWDGTLGDPGVIHPSSNQQGAGQAVSPEVNAQSAALQGVSPEQLNQYLGQQTQQGAGVAPTTPSSQPSGNFSQASQATSGAGTAGIATPDVINLPDLYKNLYDTSGISDLEADYSQKEKAFIEAKGKINDNPFLSEATRVGRVAKLESLFAERTANLQKDIATKKADIETQLNLETKQFDIESSAAQQALSQLNTLLGMGALDNASGETIASLTRSTGISSDLIISAINASKKSKEKAPNTQVITSTAENGEMYAVVMNSDTGEIISKKSLGVIGNVQSGTKQSQTEQLQAIKDDVVGDIRNGITLQQAFQLASSYLDADEILRLYNVNSPYGRADETNADLAKNYGVTLVE